MAKAIVIGGGIVGVATAWRLAESGEDVTLLESGALGGGASRASFSWFNASEKPPLAYHQLNVAGMDHYRRLWVELDQPRWLHFNGHIEWDTTPEGPEDLRAKVKRLSALGYGAELLPISELRNIEPGLVPPRQLEEFSYYPAEGHIDIIDMIGDVVARAREKNVQILVNTPVEALVTEGSHVTGVTTCSGDHFQADTVVICSGASAPDLLGQVDFDLLMAPTNGLVAVTSPSTARLRGVHQSNDLNIRPDGGGRILMRHYDFDDLIDSEMTEVPIPTFLDDLLDRAVKILPELASARVEGVRIATRPIPGDGKSVVGYIPGTEGLYLIVTHSGVTLGPLLGHLAAREIISGVRDARLNDFHPDRKIRALSKPAREN